MITGIEFKQINYPNGETGIEVLKFGNELQLVFESNQDIIDLMMIANILGDHCSNIQLIVNYFPYSRMDRVEKTGQCFSLKWFCEIINSMSFESVFVCDPHSPIIFKYLENADYCGGVFNKIDEFRDLGYKFVCPDKGAMRKFRGTPYILCNKFRDFDTGDIVKTILLTDPKDIEGCKLLILDDICDGGRTFIEIAKVLKPHNPHSISLAVSHGFFTKGLEVFDGHIDEIFCLNDNLNLTKVK